MHGSAARGIAIPFAQPTPPPTLPVYTRPSSLSFSLFHPLPSPSPSPTTVTALHTVSAHRHRGHVHAADAYREPETKFSATSPPSMLPITQCSKLNDRDSFFDSRCTIPREKKEGERYREVRGTGLLGGGYQDRVVIIDL